MTWLVEKARDLRQRAWNCLARLIRGTRRRRDVQQLSFTGREVFPAGDCVSGWLLSVCAAAEDVRRAIDAYLSCCREEQMNLRSEAAHLKADQMYYFRLACAHAAEGVDHVILRAQGPRGVALYDCATKREIRSWLQESKDLVRLWEAIAQRDNSIGEALPAIRHATFHYLGQHFSKVLEAIQDQPWTVTFGDTASYGDTSLDFVALPVLLSAYLKAKEMGGVSIPSSSQGDLGKEAEQWLREVMGEVGELQKELQYFCAAALAHRFPTTD